MREQIAQLQTKAPAGDLKARISALSDRLQSFSAATGSGIPGGPGATLAGASGRVRTLFNLIQNVDLAPTSQVVAAVPEVLNDSRAIQERWQTITSQDVAALNRELRTAGLPEIEVAK